MWRKENMIGTKEKQYQVFQQEMWRWPCTIHTEQPESNKSNRILVMNSNSGSVFFNLVQIMSRVIPTQFDITHYFKIHTLLLQLVTNNKTFDLIIFAIHDNKY